MKYAKELNADEILKLTFGYLTEISSSRDYDDVIIALAEMGRVLTNAHRCSVWIVDKESDKIWTKVAHGIEPIELPINSGIVGSAILSGEKIIIDDVYTDERFNREVDKKTGYTTKSMMVVPMFDKEGEIIGAFQVINNMGEDGLFSRYDMDLLMLTTTFAAESLISAKLTHEIAKTQKEVVFTMGAVGESRSKETGNHVKRVAEYSKILALACGMDESEAELLKQASPMHDIGKIAIPDSILNKPAKFTKSEYEIMMNHTVLGHSMIKNSKRKLLQAASVVAHQHHEKYNGKGYPQGLKGDEIHIYGRITAIADVFDALGSDRVYKKAWDDKLIFEMFKKERGEHFDPHLIDLFFENIDKFLGVREQFKDIYEESGKTDKPAGSTRVLGAYGTKSKGHGTSAFLLNESNVIDAGNLIEPLEEQCAEIENIWLTHSHLDHISDIAYILDNYFAQRKKTLNIIGLPQTIEALKKHFFNGLVWPDFSKIMLLDSNKMALNYIEIEIGAVETIAEGETIEAFKTDHTVPSCGYIYKKENRGVIITADTYSLETLVKRVNSDKEIFSMVIECSYPTELEELAKETKHLTPKLLFAALSKLKRDDVKLYINHIKPNYLQKIESQINEICGKWEPILLKDLDIVNF